MNRVRCAIYTRKSSEEGLEQSFNSLDAQREACAAYILSQASEGWVQTSELYEDGGLSGGTLQRPALQRLLANEFAASGTISPARQQATGKQIGGVPFSRGQLYLILKNRIYLGDMEHKDQVYPGLHKAILDRELFEQVQSMLKAHTQGTRDGTRAERPSLLAGRIVDEADEPLVPVHATGAYSRNAG